MQCGASKQRRSGSEGLQESTWYLSTATIIQKYMAIDTGGDGEAYSWPRELDEFRRFRQ